VNQVRAVKYNFISENDTDEKHIGFIAQDFQNILPEVISIAPQQKNMDFDVLGIAYTETIPLLLGAIKELDSIVQNQQSKIASLETKLNELFNK
jgi:trimeric autotransporter adhesin